MYLKEGWTEYYGFNSTKNVLEK